MPDVMYRVRGAGGTIELLSAAFATLTGWSPSEWIGRPFADLVYADDVRLAVDTYTAILRGEKPAPHLLRIRTKGGGYVFGEFHSAPFHEQGRVVGEQGIARDATARKQAERGLMASEERLRLLLERLPIGVALVDQDRRITYANAALAGILGIAVDDLLHGAPKNRGFVRPDGTPMPPEEFASERAFRERRPVHDVETGVITERGKTIWTSVSATPFPKLEQGVVVVTVDISKHRTARQALQSSETRFRSLIEHSSDLLTIVGGDGRLTYASPSAFRLLGYDPGELIGQVGFDYVHPDDVPRVQAAFGRALLVDSAWIRETFRFRHEDGSWRTFESVITNMVRDPSVAGVVINSRDVTDRTHAEEALQRSEVEYRGLVEHAPLGIYRATPEGRFLSVNPALVTMLGYGWAEELLNLDLAQQVYAQRSSKNYNE